MVYTFFSLLVVDLRLVENVGMVGQLVETGRMVGQLVEMRGPHTQPSRLHQGHKSCIGPE